jgi:hypothetical protein
MQSIIICSHSHPNYWLLVTRFYLFILTINKSKFKLCLKTFFKKNKIKNYIIFGDAEYLRREPLIDKAGKTKILQKYCKPAMDSTRHTCLKLQPQEGEIIFVKGTWFHARFDLSITDGLHGWICHGTSISQSKLFLKI